VRNFTDVPYCLGDLNIPAHTIAGAGGLAQMHTLPSIEESNDHEDEIRQELQLNGFSEDTDMEEETSDGENLHPDPDHLEHNGDRATNSPRSPPRLTRSMTAAIEGQQCTDSGLGRNNVGNDTSATNITSGKNKLNALKQRAMAAREPVTPATKRRATEALNGKGKKSCQKIS
jgi:hypothetical protein